MIAQNGSPSIFGTMPDGSTVHAVRLVGETFHADVISFGAALRDIVVESQSIVLGCDTLDDYVTRSPHFGAIVGRCANRIAHGHLQIDGRLYQLTLNEGGRNHLHGGAPGFSRRNWTLVEHDPTSVMLRITAQDGEQGYPGRVQASCRYTIAGPDTLEMRLEATSDQPTIVNLANHTYFNLTGEDTINSHVVQIAAERYLPVDDGNIPTGEIADVRGTRFDFRTSKSVGDARFDTPYVVDLTRSGVRESTLQPVARVAVPRLCVDIASTQPCVQFYTGQNIKAGVPGRGGKPYQPGAGLCFETQAFPDAPNHAGFPAIVLRAGETYRAITLYRLSTGNGSASGLLDGW